MSKANPGANLDVLLVVLWCLPVCLALVLNSILLKALLKALDRWRKKAEAASEATTEGAAPAASEDVPAATVSCSSESDHHPPRDAEAMEMMRMPSSLADDLEPEAGADERRGGSSAGTPNPWINQSRWLARQMRSESSTQPAAGDSTRTISRIRHTTDEDTRV